jgi:hypothetical protein
LPSRHMLMALTSRFYHTMLPPPPPPPLPYSRVPGMISEANASSREELTVSTGDPNAVCIYLYVNYTVLLTYTCMITFALPFASRINCSQTSSKH